MRRGCWERIRSCGNLFVSWLRLCGGEFEYEETIKIWMREEFTPASSMAIGSRGILLYLA